VQQQVKKQNNEIKQEIGQLDYRIQELNPHIEPFFSCKLGSAHATAEAAKTCYRQHSEIYSNTSSTTLLLPLISQIFRIRRS